MTIVVLRLWCYLPEDVALDPNDDELQDQKRVMGERTERDVEDIERRVEENEQGGRRETERLFLCVYLFNLQIKILQVSFELLQKNKLITIHFSNLNLITIFGMCSTLMVRNIDVTMVSYNLVGIKHLTIIFFL